MTKKLDLVAEIELALTELIDPADNDAQPVSAAVAAVIHLHRHDLLDEFSRETDDITRARYGYCVECGNVAGGVSGRLWCPTVRAMADALGLNGD